MRPFRTIQLRARPLNPTHYSQLCRSFTTQLSLRAPSQGDAPSKTADVSGNESASKQTDEARHSAAVEDSAAARRRRTTDSLTAFINQMMPPSKDTKKQPRRSVGLDAAESLGEEQDLGSQGPVARRQGDILRGVTGGQRFSDTLGSSRGVGRLPPLAPPVRLDAYLGRAEQIGGGVTLSRALDKLNIKLAVNKVRGDIRRQKFHERAGLKRKRLRRERWRKRFKEGFKATVQKVQRMKAQGW